MQILFDAGHDEMLPVEHELGQLKQNLQAVLETTGLDLVVREEQQ